jgi:hypothetical protein
MCRYGIRPNEPMTQWGDRRNAPVDRLACGSILGVPGGQPAALRLIGVTFCAPLSMSSNSAVQLSSAARRSLR